MSDWIRRDVVKVLATGLLPRYVPQNVTQETIRTRAIPSSGESVPVVGLGTWQTFDVGPSSSEIDTLGRVLRLFVERGGRIVDSSPMYGRSEAVVGDLATEHGLASSLFHATKVWTRGRNAGIRQMEQSFARMRVKTMDLMQVHNLVDWRTHLNTLREWKSEGRVRYLGVTHYHEGAYDDVGRIVRQEPLDFVQINYSIASRTVEQRLLPLLSDRGVAVLINRPFEEGALFGRVRGRSLPAWSEEFDCVSWAQFFLKYVLADSSVTGVIPATSNPRHLEDNMMAGFGRLPDGAMRRRMVHHFEAL